LAFLYNSNGENNNPATAKIPPILKHTDTDNATTSSRVSVIRRGTSHSSGSSRTISSPNITPSTSGSTSRGSTPITDTIPNQHEQQKDPSGNIHNSITTISTTTDIVDHPGGKRQKTNDNIRNIQPSGSSHCATGDKTKQRTSRIRTPSPEINSGQRDDNSSPTPSTSNSQYTLGTDNSDGAGITYTFILHKSTFNILPPTTKKSPTFATFDHGDHIHIIFSVKHCNNVSRHLTSITKFLDTKFEGVTEAHTTLQLVRFPNRFLSYLIRKSLSTFHKFGSRTISIIKPLMDALLQFDTTDSIPDTSLPCNQYIEEKKKIFSKYGKYKNIFN
jgi:hypothetical protein